MRTQAGQQLERPPTCRWSSSRERSTRSAPQRHLQPGRDPLRAAHRAAAVRGERVRDPRQAAETDPPAPSSIRLGLDPALDRICQKAMAREVEDRFGSMREFDQALKGIDWTRGGGRGTCRSALEGLRYLHWARSTGSSPAARQNSEEPPRGSGRPRQEASASHHGDYEPVGPGWFWCGSSRGSS